MSPCIVTRYQNTYSKQNSRLTFIIFFLSINDIDDKVAWFSICIYHYSLSIRVLCKLEIKTFSSFSHFAYNGYTQYQKIFILDFKLIFHDLLVCLYCQIRKRFLSFWESLSKYIYIINTNISINRHISKIWFANLNWSIDINHGRISQIIYNVEQEMFHNSIAHSEEDSQKLNVN